MISLETVVFNNSEECKKNGNENNQIDSDISPRIILSDNSENIDNCFTNASNAKSPEFTIKQDSPYKSKPDQEIQAEPETEDYFQMKKIEYSK